MIGDVWAGGLLAPGRIAITWCARLRSSPVKSWKDRRCFCPFWGLTTDDAVSWATPRRRTTTVPEHQPMKRRRPPAGTPHLRRQPRRSSVMPCRVDVRAWLVEGSGFQNYLWIMFASSPSVPIPLSNEPLRRSLQNDSTLAGRGAGPIDTVVQQNAVSPAPVQSASPLRQREKPLEWHHAPWEDFPLPDASRGHNRV